MNKRGPQVDRAVSAFVEDIYQRGLDQNILLVVSGEFGRRTCVQVCSVVLLLCIEHDEDRRAGHEAGFQLAQ